MAKIKNSFLGDKLFLLSGAVLLLVGLAVLWSASTVEGEKLFNSSAYFLFKQLYQGVLPGLIGFWICSKIDYRKWQKLTFLGIVASFVLLVMVKIPGLGLTANGAARWIDFGPIIFQPAEFAKIAVIAYMAGWISSRGAHGGFKESVLPPIIIVGVISAMILWQPDMGSMLSIVVASAAMLFAGGIQLRYLGGLTAIGSGLIAVLIALEPYRMRRITAFINHAIDPSGIGYQINQALIAIGSGGIFGNGYGLSRQKFFYLPEALNDSIFAVMAEELGFVRVVLIISILIFFIYRGLVISLKAPDTFGVMLALGITSSIAFNALINVAAISGLIPLTGIPLPFFSYGSSAMVVMLSSLGVVYNISKQAKKR